MSSLFGSHGDKKGADASEDDDESHSGLPDDGQRKVGRQKARKVSSLLAGPQLQLPLLCPQQASLEAQGESGTDDASRLVCRFQGHQYLTVLPLSPPFPSYLAAPWLSPCPRSPGPIMLATLLTLYLTTTTILTPP